MILKCNNIFLPKTETLSSDLCACFYSSFSIVS